VDTKYEFGADAKGQIRVIDEVHTPDSSRYWYADDYEQRFQAKENPRSLDKEFVRRTLVARGYAGEGDPPPLDDDLRVEAAKRYLEIYEQVTGQTFEGTAEAPQARIRKALGLTSAQ
jgi:phosphoribosylaminoimidazole-succinocarboxamide synthase